MLKKTIRNICSTGKTVLVRVDLNVPINKKTGSISDDSRIRASLPTIGYLTVHKARIVLCSYLGRSNGKIVEELRIKPIAEQLSHLVSKPIHTIGDCVGNEVSEEVNKLKDDDILFMEGETLPGVVVLQDK